MGARSRDQRRQTPLLMNVGRVFSRFKFWQIQQKLHVVRGLNRTSSHTIYSMNLFPYLCAEARGLNRTSSASQSSLTILASTPHFHSRKQAPDQLQRPRIELQESADWDGKFLKIQDEILTGSNLRPAEAQGLRVILAEFQLQRGHIIEPSNKIGAKAVSQSTF